MSKKTVEKPKESAESSDEVDQPDTINTGWILAVVAIIFVIGAAIFWVTSQPTSYSYNGFIFDEVDCPGGPCQRTFVETNIGVREIQFYHGPEEVADIQVNQNVINTIQSLSGMQNASIIIAFDDGVPGDVGVVASNIARVTGEKMYNIPTRGGVYGRDVVCSMSTRENIVVYVREGETSGVGFMEDCVIIQAPSVDELVRVGDAFTLHLIGVL